jgi:cell division topological specificity factor
MGWLNKLLRFDKWSDKKTWQERQALKQYMDSATSKDTACSRLKLVLMHDRSQIAPNVLDKMREEIVDVISRYVDIDKGALELKLERGDSGKIAMVANIPVLKGAAALTNPATSNT